MLISARSPRAAALLVLCAASGVLAQQLTDAPNLSTATLATATQAQSSTTNSASSGTTGGTSATGSSGTTSAGTSAATTSSGQTTTTGSATTTGSVFSLSGLPTIQGAGIPTLAIPYTADAPFMQKSNLPEGTVFIAVGATLAFLGACVLLWRGMVAWSINRSAKRAALASLRGPEKSSTWAGGSSRPGYYKEYEAGNNVSMDALTSSGKVKNYRDHDNNSRGSTVVPPSNLFFSPTANAQQRNSAINPDGNHSSTHLPAGYYASPSAAQPAGGAGATIIGGSLAPYARNSVMGTPSPPMSPKLPSSSGGTYGPAPKGGLRAGPRERLPSASRERYASQTTSTYRQSSASNLRPSSNHEHLGGTRAPSAILDDLFDNHGNVPR